MIVRRFRRMRFARLSLAVLMMFGPGGGTAMAASARPATCPHSRNYLLELCGIAGTKPIDRAAVRGIVAGGFHETVQFYDWTEHDPGMDALVDIHRNKREAIKIAALLARQIRARPGARIYILAHSGGTGLAVWALEDLPADCKINSMVLMSSALSPRYDLSKALSHITGHLYVFSSLADLLVLGVGTQLFGTIDGVKTDAAGRVGFTAPRGADLAQYTKLVSLPYDPAWIRYGDMGDHVGGMRTAFARRIIAPLLLHGIVPPVQMPATTQTATGLGRKIGP